MVDNNSLKEKESGIDIFEFLIMLWNRKKIIIPIVVFFTAFMFIKTAFFSIPMYRANGALYIRTISDELAEKENYIYGSDISAARDLTSTYKEILLTRSFLKDVCNRVNEESGKNYKWNHIKGMISVSSLNETELLSVVVTAPDPEDAYYVARYSLELAQPKFEEILNGGTVTIVDPAEKPEAPLSNNVARNTIIGLFVGLVFGVIVAFIVDLLDKKVHSGIEISKKYDASILGEISHGVTVNRKKGKSKEISESIENILNENTLFSTVETYKAIRTNIMFSIPKADKGKVIVISSSSPAEGKTTTTINLAITFAQTGSKVILVDCDLRKPRVHRYLQLSKDNGLSNVLCGFSELENSIQKSKYDSLDILVAGEIPSNPAELLDSTEFETVLDKLKSQYDYIFIDTPPMTVVTDASILMNKSNGAVIVARENYTTYDLLDLTVENIRKCNTKLFGFVLVDSSGRQKKYSYYKSGKYAYKQAYEYRYGDYGAKDKNE